ncbi:MAG: serine--tRNA ligase, partial [Spirochaetales bacterium]
MIDYRELKTRHDEIALNIKNRNMKVDLDHVIELQDCYSKMQKAVEDLRARRNEIAAQMKGPMDKDARMVLVEEGRTLKEKIGAAETELESLEKEYQAGLRQIPNYAHPDAPIGKEDKDSTAVKYVGKPPVFNFKPLDHVQLGEKLDLIDFDTATKVA